jgi:hypothetical protein
MFILLYDMVGEYLRHFQDKEDQIEGGAYLLWRRFQRLGLPNDVFSIQLTPGFLYSDSDETEPELDRSDMTEEPIFRNFTNEEIALIQLGKVVSLKEGGLGNQEELYQRLRDYFLGSGLVVDYYNALSENSDYDPQEVAWVALEHGNFVNVLDRIDDVNFI